MSDALAALQNELAEARENLALIRERMSAFVISTDVPLQWVKEERRLEGRIRELERQIAALQPINLLRRSTKLLVGPVAEALTGEPWKDLRQRLLTQASKLPHSAHLDLEVLQSGDEEWARLNHELRVLLAAYRIAPNPGQLEALEQRAAPLARLLLCAYRLSADDAPALAALAAEAA